MRKCEQVCLFLINYNGIEFLQNRIVLMRETSQTRYTRSHRRKRLHCNHLLLKVDSDRNRAHTETDFLYLTNARFYLLQLATIPIP